MAVNAVTRLFDSLLYGPVPPYRGASVAVAASAIAEVAPQPIRTSWVFDSHVQEAQGSSRGGKNPQSVSMAWDENEARGIDASMRSWQGLTARERKETLLGIYLANPWASACADVIAKRITSGGLSFEALTDNPDKSHLKTLEQFCLRVNDEWDFLQYVRASIIDKLIFGETYTEIVWDGKVPYMLYKVDCLTMSYRLDMYGRVETFLQSLDHTNEPNKLDPKNIVRWWLPHPRAAMDPFSPLERVTDAVLLDKKMVNWMTTFFQKGAKFPFHIDGGENWDGNEAERYKTFFEQNYTGEKNAHTPVITYGGAKLIPNGKGSIDIDFPMGRDRNRTEVLTAYHVPPAIVGIIETGNIGGGSGEDQEKSFQFNTCDPIRHTFFEKFNDRVVKRGFGITDYRVTTRYADYRTDDAVAKVQDTRIRNGSVTINETREEMGKKPYKDGGSTAIVVASRDIVPVPRLDALEDEQTQSAQLDIEAKQTANEKAKEPTPPPAAPGQAPVNQPGQPKQGDVSKTANTIAAKGQQANGKKAQTKEDASQHYTGMMLAFLLDAETASKLALPGGEPASQLHITLAYLGDMEDDEPTDGTLRPDTSPFKIRDAVAMIASAAHPLSGMVGGIGRFFPAETDETPIIALVDVPGLTEFRTKLVTVVQAVNYNVADNHGYTPHITLAYIDASAPMPIKDIPPLPLVLDTVWLCVGDKRMPFKLGDEQYPQYWDKKQESAPPTNSGVWEPDDVEEQLDALRARGVVSQTWDADEFACDTCIQNNGVTVNIGDPFPSGHRLVFAHPNEQCTAEYHFAQGEGKHE